MDFGYAFKALRGCLVLASCVASAAPGDGGWARPDLVGRAERGEIGTANVSWWGYDPVDSTRYLSAALASKARRIVVDSQSGPWVTMPLKGRSDLELVIPEGVELRAKRGEYHGRNDCLIVFDRSENVVLTGGGTLSMWVEDYTNKNLYAWSEWRHAVALHGCRSVKIENLTIRDSGGDGIYISNQGDALACVDVVIRDVRLCRNNRQGISVISADRLLVERCVMEDTCGTPPMSGIDFEPNGGREMLRDIVVRNCISRRNRGAGFEFAVGNLNASSPAISIVLENCRSEGNRRPVSFYHHGVHTLSGARGTVEFRDSVFDDADPTWRVFRPSSGPETMSVKFTRCKAADPKQAGVLLPMGPDCGWDAVTPPTWPDGSPILQTPPEDPDPEKTRVFDMKPGQLTELLPLHARGTKEYLVYSDGARKVRISGKVLRVGRSSFGGCSGEVYSMKGRTIARFKGPSAFEEKASFGFAAPEKGFYRLIVRPSRGHVCLLTESDSPIAAIRSAARGLPGGNGRPSEVCLRIADGVSRFAVAFTGGGGNEFIHARVFNPRGECVWDEDNVGVTRLWFPPAQPEPGIWRLSATKASEGCLDDYTFAAFGVPCHLFLTPEKTWIAE